MKALICEHHRYDSVLRVGSHQIAGALRDRGYEIVWVAHPRSWLHRLLGPLPEPLIRHPDGTIEVTLRAPLPYIGRLPPLGVLAWGRRWLKALPRNRRYLREALGSEVCDLAWISDFTALPVLDMVSVRDVVFRYFDLLEHYPRTPRSLFRLIVAYRHRASVEVASSAGVVDSLRSKGIDAMHLPNAIRVSAFPRELSAAEDRRREAIYVGALREWFDLEAVETFARRLPDVLFRLVGPDEAGLAARLGAGISNVVFHGGVDHQDLPRLLAGARFGLIPFRRTELTRGVNPLKLYEYLAAGLPVLSVDLPEVQPRPEGVFVYKNADEGATLLESQIDAPFDRGALRCLAEANDWNASLDRVFRAIRGDGPTCV